MNLRLVPVTRHNLDAVCALDAGDGGRQVAGNQRSMAQAAVHPEAWPRAIEVDGEIVGFAMLYDPTLCDEPAEPDFCVWRLMVDKRRQGEGIGHAALRVLIAHVRSRPGAKRLLISHVADVPRLGRLYAELGFVATGEVGDGEVVMALEW